MIHDECSSQAIPVTYDLDLVFVIAHVPKTQASPCGVSNAEVYSVEWGRKALHLYTKDGELNGSKDTRR